MRIYTTSASFTRPSNTTAYTAQDLVANDTVAGNVVPMTFIIPTQGMLLIGAKITMTGTGLSGPIGVFDINLYQFSPTSSAGDNAAYQATESGWLGQTTVDCSAFTSVFNNNNFTDGYTQIDPFSLLIIPDNSPALTTSQIYGLLQVSSSGAYTPGSGAVFTVTLYGVD